VFSGAARALIRRKQRAHRDVLCLRLVVARSLPKPRSRARQSGGARATRARRRESACACDTLKQVRWAHARARARTDSQHLSLAESCWVCVWRSAVSLACSLAWLLSALSARTLTSGPFFCRSSRSICVRLAAMSRSRPGSIFSQVFMSVATLASNSALCAGDQFTVTSSMPSPRRCACGRSQCVALAICRQLESRGGERTQPAMRVPRGARGAAAAARARRRPRRTANTVRKAQEQAARGRVTAARPVPRASAARPQRGRGRALHVLREGKRGTVFFIGPFLQATPRARTQKARFPAKTQLRPPTLL
jgi:hypothetical protein